MTNGSTGYTEKEAAAIFSLFANSQKAVLTRSDLLRDIYCPELTEHQRVYAVVEEMKRKRLIFYDGGETGKAYRNYGVTTHGYDVWENITENRKGEHSNG